MAETGGKMTTDVTILGAGIVGICTALSAQERGLSVRLIDRGDPGQATSFGNAGVISPGSVVPAALPGAWKKIPAMMLDRDRPLAVNKYAWPRMIGWGARFVQTCTAEQAEKLADAMALLCGPCIDLYARHLKGTGAENLLRDSCYIHVFRNADQARLDAFDYQLRGARGVRIDRLDQAELQAMEPALSPDFTAAIVLRDQARALSPGRIGQVLADKVRKQGGDILTAEIDHIRRDENGWSVICGADHYRSPRLVLSMGAWSPSLLAPFGLKPPLMAERGYHMEFPDPGIDVMNSIMDVDRKVVASSMQGGVRVAGFADFAPVNAPPDTRRRAQLERLGPEIFPDLAVREPRFWMGRRPSFPDSIPALGEHPALPGLIWNFGHSHHGLMMAPKSGEIAAGLAAGIAPNADISTLAPDRFD